MALPRGNDVFRVEHKPFPRGNGALPAGKVVVTAESTVFRVRNDLPRLIFIPHNSLGLSIIKALSAYINETKTCSVFKLVV